MDTGTKVYRNYFPIKFGLQADIQFGKAYPVFRKLMYPGDVFKVHADLLIRYQPMFTPPMNDCVATVRFGFVPLQLIESNTELIVTGSNDGHLSEETIPVMDSVFKYLNVGTVTINEKHSVLDYLYQIPAGINLATSGLLDKLDVDKASPAAYFAKAFYRFWWDYYRDENLFTAYTDFESYWNTRRLGLHSNGYIPSVCLKKDRLTSALPWQLKAVAPPMIEINGAATFTPNYTNNFFYGLGNTASDYPIPSDPNTGEDNITYANNGLNFGLQPFALQQGLLESDDDFASRVGIANTRMKGSLNQAQSITPVMAGFSGAQFREMMAQTRIFERLARCGSRYTEYLRANFGIAPAV